ncbi:nucleotide disphospho-sugar-binding domain-containing protein [Paenibacillus alkalitolerans]|uniref:nucleotide disphospho-sugar-binding domain-containing protein n=1 Tax=Paenibacillus alkalitolerans TaxID=2799335 RepID=UPI0018F3EC8A|nr:nucleotide disphospho-sugar-binding domain-containing protein [Paenibacillus alkalitolerans]
MKILFTSFPGLGHFLPVVPLAWAARAAGHEVLVVTTGPAVEASGRAGLPTVEASPEVDIMAAIQKSAVQSFQDPFSSANLAITSKWMAEISHYTADRTVQIARSWKPDVIVQTPFEAAGSLAATLLSVPTLVHGFGILSLGKMSGFMNLIYEAMRPVSERIGLTGDLVRPSAIIDTCPPSMRESDRPPAWFVRYVPYNGGGLLPDWLLEPTSRPRICITLGTVLPHLAGIGGISGIIEAVRHLDAEVILALGGSDPSALGPLPSNVRTIGWVPLSALIPSCSAIIHHGGAGTTMNAVVAGVPQLVLPHGADQHINANAVKQRGIGLAYLPGQADVETVKFSLKQLLEDSGFTRAAQDVKEENLKQVPPASIVPRLSELTGRS